MPLLALAAEVNVTVTDAAGKPVSDAVVAVFDGKTAAVNAQATGKIVQKNKQFNPGVSVIQTGTTVSFPNEDSVRHHVYSFSPAKKFELKLYSGVASNPVVFDKPGVVILGCNIHDTMVGYIYVVDTPFYGKTDANGKATLHLAPGQVTVQVWPAGKLKAAIEQAYKIDDQASIKVVLP